jgi:hypothetical protein
MEDELMDSVEHADDDEWDSESEPDDDKYGGYVLNCML